MADLDADLEADAPASAAGGGPSKAQGDDDTKSEAKDSDGNEKNGRRRSAAELIRALSIADAFLDPSASSARQLTQRIVTDLVETLPADDGSISADQSESVQRQLILRLDNPVTAARMALEHMDSWHDPQETLRVLFCVLAALQGATGSGPGDETATLEAKVRYKYLVCLYHEQLRESVSTAPGGADVRLRDMSSGRRAFEEHCRRDLASAVEAVIRARQVVLAEKIFHLFGPSDKKAAGAAAVRLQAKVQVARSAADIAAMLREGSRTRERLRAVERLRSLGPRTFVVAKDLLVQLDSAHALSVVVEFLKQYLDKSASDPAVRALLADRDEMRWFTGVRLSAGLLCTMPRDLQQRLLPQHQDPGAVLRGALAAGRADLVHRALSIPLFAQYRRMLQRDQAGGDPIEIVLQFGIDALTLRVEGVTKVEALSCLELCLAEPEMRPRVRSAVLYACNELSRRLSAHKHKLLIVQMMQSLLRFFEERCLVGAPPDIASRFHLYRGLAFSPRELQRTEAGGGDAKAVAPRGGVDTGMLLYRMRRVQFCMDDLLDKTRAARLRDRLMKEDEMDLAAEVWARCEGGNPSAFERKRKKFEEKMQAQCAEYRKAYGAKVGARV